MCYFVDTGNHKKWFELPEHCLAIGGRPLKLNTIEEFNKVKSYLSLKNTGGYFDARWPNNFGKKFGFIARDGQFICLS